MLVLDASMALASLFIRQMPAERDCADRSVQALHGAPASVPAIWHAEVANSLLVARKYDRTVYDACYLELALRLSATLATFDRKLAAAAVAAGAVVFA